MHVDRDEKTAKFWISPTMAIASNYGFSPPELTLIMAITRKHQKLLLEKWHEYFGT